MGCFDKTTDADGDGYFASEDCDDNNPPIPVELRFVMEQTTIAMGK